MLVPLLSAFLVATAARGCLSLPELPVWTSLSVVRFFFFSCLLTLSFNVAALRAVVSALLFVDVSFLAGEVSEVSDVFFVFFLCACSASLSASSRVRFVVELAAGTVGSVGGTLAGCFDGRVAVRCIAAA